MNFPDKKFIFIFISIIFILFLGIFIRMDSIGLEGVSLDKKAFYEDSDGQQYMYDMDSYYNYRLSNNLLKTGKLGDVIYENKEWDLHSYYPHGVPLDYPPLIAYLSVLIYKLINLFYQVELLNVCFALPAFIAPLAGIFVFLFIYRIKSDKNGLLGGLAAGLLMVCAPFYFMRTVPGFFDTDMFNLLFPILIVWFLFEAIKSDINKNIIIFTVLSSISLLFFALAWNGWQFLYFVILISAVIYYISPKLRKKEPQNIKNKNQIYTLFLFLLLSLTLIISLNGVENLIKIVYGPLEAFKLTSTSIWYPWPDPYQFISELQAPGLINIILGLGPGLIIAGFMGIISLVYTYFKRDSKITTEMKFLIILLIVWVLTSSLSLFKGIRFEIILIAPLSIGAGIFICMLNNYLDQQFSTNHHDKSNYLKYIFIILLIGLLVIPSVLTVQENYKNLTPRTNDNLWDSAIWIKENTANNTVIISNWVHGHFFATISNRSVDFDGRLGYVETIPVRKWQYGGLNMDIKTPNVYREYWQDKAMSTSNFTLSSGILRMLSTSGDDAYLTLENYTQNPERSVRILEDVLGLNKDQAYLILTQKYQFNPNISQKILQYTHPSKENPYILVTYDALIEKGYWIFYYGNWDFKTAIGQKPSYSYGDVVENSSNSLVFDNDVLFDLIKLNATWLDKKPKQLVIIDENYKKEKSIEPSSDFNIYVLLDKNMAVVLDKKFENSVFVKLLLENDGSGKFKLLYKKGDVHLWTST